MPRRYPLCVLALCLSIAIGCGKKEEDPEPVAGGSGGGARSNGAPFLRPRNSDDKKEAVHRLRLIGVAMHNFESSNGYFPAGVVGPNGQLGLSWRVAILPYIEQDALYKEFKLDEPWDSEHNKKLIARMPKLFEAPGTISSNGKTFLRSFAGPQGFIPGAPVLPKGPSKPKGSPGFNPAFTPWANQPAGSPARGRPIASIPDGTSNTLMVVEAAEAVEWTQPDEIPYLDGPAGPPGGQTFPMPRLGGLFDGGFHALMCDGSVRFFRDGLDERTLRALITVNGGEVVSVSDGGPAKDPVEGFGGAAKAKTKPAPAETKVK